MSEGSEVVVEQSEGTQLLDLKGRTLKRRVKQVLRRGNSAGRGY